MFNKCFEMFSSPSRGSYISTLSACDDSSDFFSFSSPSRGSYILYETKVNYDGLAVFSSPSRGSYISTVNGVAYTLNATEAILVPFPGFLYLYISFDDLQMAFSEFSSPSRGSYISTYI